jgi:hypothetical protein
MCDQNDTPPKEKEGGDWVWSCSPWIPRIPRGGKISRSPIPQRWDGHKYHSDERFYVFHTQAASCVLCQAPPNPAMDPVVVPTALKGRPRQMPPLQPFSRHPLMDKPAVKHKHKVSTITTSYARARVCLAHESTSLHVCSSCTHTHTEAAQESAWQFAQETAVLLPGYACMCVCVCVCVCDDTNTHMSASAPRVQLCPSTLTRSTLPSPA